jgi:uncharacterized membrane protein YdfJ with MMPL/SSD domain
MHVRSIRAHADWFDAERAADEPLLARTTRWTLRFRRAVLAAWFVLMIGGGLASTRLSPLLSNGFGVPGTDSARAATILARQFHDRSDGEYLLVFATRRPLDPTLRTQLQAAVDRAASRVPSAHAGPVQAAGLHVLYDTVVSQLDLARAKSYSGLLLSALRPPTGVRGYVTGQAAIQHDLDPVFSSDLRHGEFAIAVPAALVVLLLVLGLSAIVTLPLLFAGATIATTLGLVFAVAHTTVMATYVTNLVELIGLALAIDYSLLVVYRFREESLLLPLKAVLLTLLSVSASYGMLVVFFRWGVGARTLGTYRFDQIEGWIPIFLFALLFGLSMDYEVFIVTRMREAWDAGLDNTHAVADGLKRTGRIVTAAAIIMVAAFSGFVGGRIAGLQEFGLGLAVAILVDATIVRAVLVPSLMAVLGRWNWWLPTRVARVARVEPSPLTRRPERSC